MMSSKDTKKIILGTAQLDQIYGINSKERIGNSEAKKILKFSKESGINYIDTAPVYGNSEKIIGSSELQDLKIISKLPVIPRNTKSVKKWVLNQVLESLSNLNKSSLDTLLLHDPKILLKKEGKIIYEAMESLKKENKVKKIGISIYAPNILNQIIKKFDFEVVQAPLNIFDQRILERKYLDLLCENNIQLHARSIFLQGLILREQNFEKKYFSRWKESFLATKSLASKHNLSILELCLSFIISKKEVDKFLIGVDSLSELKMIISFLKKGHEIKEDMKHLSCSEENLINPTKWPKNNK